MEYKIKKTLSRDELSRYLHTLADALENAEAVHDPQLAMLKNAFDKLELKCKREVERFGIKLKLESDDRGTPSAGPVRASSSEPSTTYKALKKRMQVTFKRLGAVIADNQIPNGPLLLAFQQDALEMIRFPDRGEPHYEAFEAACRRLAEASQNNQPGEVRQAFEVLKRMKKDCHARYK